MERELKRDRNVSTIRLVWICQKGGDGKQKRWKKIHRQSTVGTIFERTSEHKKKPLICRHTHTPTLLWNNAEPKKWKVAGKMCAECGPCSSYAYEWQYAPSTCLVLHIKFVGANIRWKSRKSQCVRIANARRCPTPMAMRSTREVQAGMWDTGGKN